MFELNLLIKKERGKMKTQVMTFKINKSYEHWEKNFDSHREIQAAAGMTPLYRGRSEDDPQKVCIVVRMADEEKAANFMEENKDAILESGHILETTERTVYIGWITEIILVCYFMIKKLMGFNL